MKRRRVWWFLVGRPAGAWLIGAFVLLLTGCGGSPERALKLGDKYLAEGNREKAIAAYSKAIGIDPNCLNAYLSRAMCYNETNQPEKAIKDFSAAIKLDPRGSAYAYDQRAILYRTVLHDEARARADKKCAEAIRDKRWQDLPKLRRRE